VCVVLSLLFVWAGLAVAYYSRFPVGFVISGLAFTGYLLARLTTGLHRPLVRELSERIQER
jgi:zinc/manganese transport system permease protein